MSQETMALVMQVGPLVLLIALMYFMLIRPQKKKEKEVGAMRAALKAGDSIVTIGGICGKVVKVKEETVIIAVGADKVKMEMMKWSISQVLSKSETKALKDGSSKPKKLGKKEEKEEILDVEIEPVTKEEAVETVETEVAEENK